MRNIITVLMVVTIIISGCDKKTTDSNNDGNDVQSYSTLNVKENTEYFSFSNNSGSTDANSDYDLMFYSIQWQPDPLAPVIYDPRFKTKDGLSIAVLENESLENITEVPNTAEFITDFVSEYGEWYDETDAHVIVPYEKVYIVNTTDGKFPAFQITSYYAQVGDEVVSGIFSFDWKYLSE